MSFNLETVYKMLNKIWRNFKHHDGRGGNAHPNVNSFNSGFMSPEQLANLEMARGAKISKPKGTDVLELEAGLYEIAGAKNNPMGESDGSYTEYDIRTSPDSSRRTIVATHSVNGNRWLRTIHTDGTPESGTGGWIRMYPKTEKIWTGYQTSGTIVLQNSLSNFDYIEIGYTTGQGISTMRYWGANKLITYPVSGVGFNNDLSQKQVFVYEATLNAKTDKIISITRNEGIVISSNGVTDTKIDDSIAILHVAGFNINMI